VEKELCENPWSWCNCAVTCKIQLASVPYFPRQPLAIV
jgi:hypothetical protein